VQFALLFVCSNSCDDQICSCAVSEWRFVFSKCQNPKSNCFDCRLVLYIGPVWQLLVHGLASSKKTNNWPGYLLVSMASKQVQSNQYVNTLRTRLLKSRCRMILRVNICLTCRIILKTQKLIKLGWNRVKSVKSDEIGKIGWNCKKSRFWYRFYDFNENIYCTAIVQYMFPPDQ
jgi:hypothetical protein